jgi:hypothetical protein
MFSNERPPDDEMLVRYLVGTTTDEETESIDELSIGDEAFALRLRAVEHDLVDAYASGELSGDVLEHFTSHYLSSPAGRTKVDIATTLRAYRGTGAATRDSHVFAPHDATWWSRKWLAAVAALLLAIGATLALDNVRLRRQASDARERQLTLERRERELQSELAGAARESARDRERTSDRGSQPAAANYVVSVILFPATRNAQRVPTIALSKNADAVMLELEPGPEEFQEYRAVVEDAASDLVVWRSGPLRAVSNGGRRILAMPVRANLLQTGEYDLKLTGIPAAGEAKVLDSYPFRVVLQ